MYSRRLFQLGRRAILPGNQRDGVVEGGRRDGPSVDGSRCSLRRIDPNDHRSADRRGVPSEANSTQFQSGGILVGPAIAGTTVSDNHVSGADIGIYQLFATPNCCTISDNTLQDNRFFGIAIQDSDGTTRENTISGGQVGIGVIADAVDTTGVLRGDSISGTTVAPVREIECCGFTATAIVKN
jgi:parallel beta-helix repeat protein